MNETEIRNKLTEVLEKEPNNYGKILELSSQLASYDQNNVRFSVDAGVIDRLGKELVARHETAVSELVKNAYDADATTVDLIFENSSSKGGILKVLDDGVGMTRKQLIDGFMRLSSSDKVHNPLSPRYLRTRAGKKGIGRFATQRLGDKLTIITQTLNSKNALKISIDWRNFEVDKDLSSVSNSIVEIPKTKDEGTDLIIENLREGWSDSMIKRVYRYTADLLQPFPLSKKRIDKENSREDLGFQSAYFRNDGNGLIKIIDEEEAFLKHALAEIEGFVLDNGQGRWTLKSEKLEFSKEEFHIGKNKDLPESKFEYIKGIHFKTSYFIYESGLLPNQTLTFIREVANERGGIRVYRNGFRVLPYGEKLNDWLGLDESSGRRVYLFPHRNINFFGFVEITDESGLTFDETSSREGLFNNEAFEELVDFVQRSIISALFKISELRGKKGKTAQKNWTKNVKPEVRVDSAIEIIKEVIDNNHELDNKNSENPIQINNSDKVKLSEAFKDLFEGREDEKKEKQELIDEINMLRVLAGLGLVIGEFVHEVKRFLPGFNTDISYLKNIVKEYSDGLKRAERLETNIRSFTAYTSYFDKAISRNVLRELQPIELRDAVNDFRDIIKNELDRTGIILHKPVFHGFDLFTIPMHPSEWSSILFNFYTNSKKAIKRKGGKGELFIEAGKENGILYLEFSDNGDGIAKKDEDNIFNAFFTTSSAASHTASYIDSLTGTGLGLKIVKDIIESYDGNVFVVPARENFSTTIRVELPANKNENYYE